MQIAQISTNNVNSVLNNQTGSVDNNFDSTNSDFANKLNQVKEKIETLSKSSNSNTKTKDDAQLKKTCQDFESIFINMMFKEMRNSVQKSDVFSDGNDNGNAMDTYQGMLDEEYSKEISKRGIGLADVMYKQLSKEEKAKKE